MVERVFQHLSKEVDMTTKKANTTNTSDVQRPIKQAYKEDASKAQITLRARACMAEGGPYACSVETAKGLAEAQAHAGVGGPGTAACSGDLLLAALASCTQITLQMVAAGMGLSLDDIQVEVQGDLDLRGTLGVSRQVPVGFQSIRTSVNVKGSLEPAQLQTLRQMAGRYCVVLATLQAPPPIETEWSYQEAE